MGWAWVNLGNIELRLGNSALGRVALERAMIEDPTQIEQVGPVWRRLVRENWDADGSALRWELMLLTTRDEPARRAASARLAQMGWSEEDLEIGSAVLP